uniref:Uncharacterized protein n=1 Tax=Arundo donax TaxID=35708 RepID=A0A0A9FJY2_ARUDO
MDNTACKPRKTTKHTTQPTNNTDSQTSLFKNRNLVTHTVAFIEKVRHHHHPPRCGAALTSGSWDLVGQWRQREKEHAEEQEGETEERGRAVARGHVADGGEDGEHAGEHEAAPGVEEEALEVIADARAVELRVVARSHHLVVVRHRRRKKLVKRAEVLVWTKRELQPCRACVPCICLFSCLYCAAGFASSSTISPGPT